MSLAASLESQPASLPPAALSARILTRVKRCLLATTVTGGLGALIGACLPPADGPNLIGCLAQMVAGAIVFGGYGIFIGLFGGRLRWILLGTAIVGILYNAGVTFLQIPWSSPHFAHALTMGMVGGSLFSGLIGVCQFYVRLSRRISLWLQTLLDATRNPRPARS